MASTMIHFVTSKYITERLNTNDVNRFLLGAVIAPDSASHEDKTYDSAHFWHKIPEQSIKGINWTDFIIKYKNEMKDEFFCGYWCHLMQNAIWFHDIVNPYIRIYPKEIKKDCYQKVYRDYERLNYLLPKQYGIDDLSIHNVHIANAEVKEQNFDTKICDFQSQFYAHKCEKGELEILQWDIICEYISKCVEFCVKEIIALRSGNERTESSDFYVSI